MLTTGQLTTTVCKADVGCEEIELDAHGAWRVHKHRKPRFLPESTLPQSYEALAAARGIEARAPPRGWKTKVNKVPWGRVLHSAQLLDAVGALLDDKAARATAMVRLAEHDASSIPVLGRAQHDFVRSSVYGGRTEPFEQLFEPQYQGATVGTRGANGVEWTPTPTSDLGALLASGVTDFEPGGFAWDLVYYDCVSLYPSEMMGDL
eukprot:2773021-Prymnesium_polylepis.1